MQTASGGYFDRKLRGKQGANRGILSQSDELVKIDHRTETAIPFQFFNLGLDDLGSCPPTMSRPVKTLSKSIPYPSTVCLHGFMHTATTRIQAGEDPDD
jgi:hypothetical protein